MIEPSGSIAGPRLQYNRLHEGSAIPTIKLSVYKAPSAKTKTKNKFIKVLGSSLKVLTFHLGFSISTSG